MRSLNFQQLNSKLVVLAELVKNPRPSTGWIRAIRTTIGMSMEQLGNKLSNSKQGIRAIEKREEDGSITIKSLREVAKALDMQLVYALVPNDGSLELLIDRKANELAKKIVMRTSQSMKLENQENSKKRIEKAIQERAEAIKSELPKTLWD